MELIFSIGGLVIAIVALGITVKTYRKAETSRHLLNSMISNHYSLLNEMDTVYSQIRALEKPRPAVKAVAKKEAAKVAKKAVKKTATPRPKR